MSCSILVIRDRRVFLKEIHIPRADVVTKPSELVRPHQLEVVLLWKNNLYHLRRSKLAKYMSNPIRRFASLVTSFAILDCLPVLVFELREMLTARHSDVDTDKVSKSRHIGGLCFGFVGFLQSL